ncbi:hypothetical protein [Segetibacter aerophilus]|uniref:Uncharacterized protein n=1 Tax=Segetibacter aerophilus TaxID=670293 RepID=A0A512BCZ7_9BACT|nr:hypothetical protein [Segetibacter aerophilus]GEO09842.1 hypothetical protein SAE01_23380 [Segetibacter aerophilus]
MKKAFLTLLIVAFCACASFAQKFTIGGVHRGGTSPVDKQKLAEKLKSELKLTDDEANAVVVIQQDYQLKSRSVKIDTQTTDKEKKKNYSLLKKREIKS